MTDIDSTDPTAVSAHDHTTTEAGLKAFQLEGTLVVFDGDDDDRWLRSDTHVELAGAR